MKMKQNYVLKILIYFVVILSNMHKVIIKNYAKIIVKKMNIIRICLIIKHVLHNVNIIIINIINK